MRKNLEHDPVRVVEVKGEKSCLRRTTSTNITSMACVNADSGRMPQMFVVKEKTTRSLYGFNTTVARKGSKLGWRKNGSIDDLEKDGLMTFFSGALWP
jgi:hypothetical protein